MRLGDTVSKIKVHEWFNSVDWENLFCKNSIPPFKPVDRRNDSEIDEDQLSEYDSEWDHIIVNDSQESEGAQNSLSGDDDDVQDYNNSIPYNWDSIFG